MKQRERLLATLAVGGVAAFFLYWLYLRFTDPDNAPSLGELWETVVSFPVRGYLIMRGKVEQALALAGGSQDPKVIAAGLIATEEGFSPRAYADPPGQTEKHSIGYGHQIVPGDGLSLDSVISQGDAFSLLLQDLDRFAECVDSAVSFQISAKQRAALYSFCYNEGCGAFQSSTMLRMVNEGDLGGASGEFDKWVYITQNGQKVVSDALQQRRNDEQELFSQDLNA